MLLLHIVISMNTNAREKKAILFIEIGAVFIQATNFYYFMLVARSNC